MCAIVDGLTCGVSEVPVKPLAIDLRQCVDDFIRLIAVVPAKQCAQKDHSACQRTAGLLLASTNASAETGSQPNQIAGRVSQHKLAHGEQNGFRSVIALLK